MQIPTNPIGILQAEIDSAGSLKLAGDRVLFGARGRAQAETEWLTRQRVAKCRDSITAAVHDHGGIVSRGIGDTLCCHLPDAPAAVGAAIAIQRAQSARAKRDDEAGGRPMTPLGVRITLGYGPLLVDAGTLSGEALATTGHLLAQAESQQILATRAVLDALPAELGSRARRLGPVPVDGAAEPVEVYEIPWTGEPGPSRTLEAAAGPAPETEPAPDAEQAAAAAGGPTLTIRSRGQQRTLGPAQPTLTLRSGQAPHARLVLEDGRFFLENLSPRGTWLKDAEGNQTHCLERAQLSGAGALSLGGDDANPAQLIEYSVSP